MKNTGRRRQSGFSMLELIFVIAILAIILAATFKQIGGAQRRYQVEDQKLDLTQTEREFIDQFTRDMHQAGYPTRAMYANRYALVSPGAPPNPMVAVNSKLVAAGVWFVSPTDVAMEGDLDGQGNVQVIQYHYDDGSSWTGTGPNPCPCLRRSSIPKIDGNPWDQNVPLFYTEVQNLVPSQQIFTFYNAAGQVVSGTITAGSLSTSGAAPTGGLVLGNDTSGINSLNQASLQSIRAIRIDLTTQGKNNDPDTHNSIQVTMTGSARLPNN
jgi:prepilin-type N-terminal cleavage/methylation domain-containing protein